MKKIQVNIPEGTRYLSEIEGFELPNGIFNKSVTGCGATTLAIEDSNPTIICSPRVALIENKIAQHTNLFWYQYNTPASTLREYIKSIDTPKIMVTFDSLHKLVSLLNIDEYRVVVDEFQRLLTDSSFKSETEFMVLESLKNFKYITYLSATPILDKYISQIGIFDDVDYYEAVWTNAEKINIISHQTKSPERTISKIISRYRAGSVEFTHSSGERFKSDEAVIYVNSVRTIINSIKNNKLAPEEVNIIVSNNERNEKAISKLGEGYSIGVIPNRGEEHKKFTFCTSTAFDGVDMYSTNASTFVISNYKIDNLLMDIRTDLAQIAGRQRLDENLLRDTVVFFYNEGFDEENAAKYREQLDRKLIETEDIVQNRNNLKEKNEDAFNRDIKDWEIRDEDTRYSETYVMVHNGKFVTNRMLYLNEQYKIDLCVDFAKNGINILMSDSDTFNNVGKDNELSLSFGDIIDISLVDTMFEQRMKNYCTLREAGMVGVTNMMENESPRYKMYYEALGADKCKALNYKGARLKREYEATLRLSDGGIADEIRKIFTPDGVANKDIKNELQKIFDKRGIKKKAKANMVEDYLDVYSTKVNINGKRVRGYKLEADR